MDYEKIIKTYKNELEKYMKKGYDFEDVVSLIEHKMENDPEIRNTTLDDLFKLMETNLDQRCKTISDESFNYFNESNKKFNSFVDDMITVFDNLLSDKKEKPSTEEKPQPKTEKIKFSDGYKVPVKKEEKVEDQKKEEPKEIVKTEEKNDVEVKVNSYTPEYKDVEITSPFGNFKMKYVEKTYKK